MIRKIELNGADLVGFEVSGEITAEDYTQNILPVMEEARNQGKKLRLLLHFTEEFSGFTAGAAWQDLKLGLRYLRIFERCAIVADQSWIRAASNFFGSLVPCAVRSFSQSNLGEAKSWLGSGEIGLDYHLDESKGLLLVELSAPLTSENFDIMASAVDSWIERKGQLKGLVLHVQKFPGWENFGSFLSHIDFVKNHHRRIQRVALCADGTLLDFVPMFTRHFVEAEIKHFDYNDLESAKVWAIG